MKNECLTAALRELSEAGIRDVQRSYGSKHPQLRWRVNGMGLRIYTVPGTPSDVRSVRNVRAEVRRMLREDGVLPANGGAGQAPPPQPSRIERLERRLAEVERRLEELAKG